MEGTRSDGVVTIRPFVVDDRAAVLAGRDEEWARWLGPGSPDPAPTACIEHAGVVVGWVDADLTAPWLAPGDANVGYAVHVQHRGHGYAARAVRLFSAVLAEEGVGRALLVIDRQNAASVGVARAVGARQQAGGLAGFPSSVVYVIELDRRRPEP